jgi:hypothetical protein
LQTTRRAGISCRHLGHTLLHDFRLALLTLAAALLRSSRVRASALATAHCGCVPVAEYEGFPHTGQFPRARDDRKTNGFFSLMSLTSRTQVNASSARVLCRSLSEPRKPLGRERRSPSANRLHLRRRASDGKHWSARTQHRTRPI